MRYPISTFLSFCLAFFAGAFLLSSCTTEVDLVAPYKATPVIIGVLDFKADTQFFRINKTFLGEGDNNVYAGIKDSVEYPDGSMNALLIKTLGGVAIDSISLLPIDLISRDPGLFYNSQVKYYYTAEPLLTESEIAAVNSSNPAVLKPNYKLDVNASGQNYTATTNFPSLGLSTITAPPSETSLDFYSIFGNGSFRTQSFSYNTSPTVGAYELYIRINFDVAYADGTTDEGLNFDYLLEKRDNSTNSSTDTRLVRWSPELFYQFIGPRFRAYPNDSKIRLTSLEYRLIAANDDLARYISIAQPESQFVPILSGFTNLTNGAIGIFAARGSLTRTVYMNDASLEQLRNGPITSGPCYCATWAGVNATCSDPVTNCP